MDPIDVVGLACSLIDIDSTTGREGDLSRWLADLLRARGYQVTEQPVDNDRFNIFATLGPPAIVFSTHLDCVPPFFASRVESDRLFGRGACDAKGILAAQIAAAERLRARGADALGLLFVVGEERGSDGAAAANGISPGSLFLINGEPTDNRLGLATRGVLRVKLLAHGRAAHSAYPHLGDSAIEKLIDALTCLRTLPFPSDPELGETTYNIGVLSGGVAPNVVPAAAEAEVLFRTVGPGDAVQDLLSALTDLVEISYVLEVPPVRLQTVPGFDTATFSYTTDIPLLNRWGRPLLYGPGSVLVAHTDDEHVRLDDLYRAVDDYERLAHDLLTA